MGGSDPSEPAGILEEDRFLRESVGVLDQRGRGELLVEGKGALGLLQRLVSSDVKSLAEGQGQPSCLLTGKGKLLGAFHLYRTGAEAFRLSLGEPLRAAFADTLRKYASLEDIDVREAERQGCFAVQGPRAEEMLRGWIEEGRLPAEPFREEAVRAGGLRFTLRRGGETPAGGFELREPSPELWSALLERTRGLGGGPVGPETAEVHRIEAGVPRWGVDFDGDNFPNECGWEAALDYQKGCYIGQEVIARMRTYGHVNRRLMMVLLPDSRKVARGTRLYRDEKEVGEVTSSALPPRSGHTVALAYLRRGSWDPGTFLSVAHPESPPEARLADRPQN